jgi:hypothetical protein
MGGQPYVFNARTSDGWRDLLAAALTCKNLISGILKAGDRLAVLIIMTSIYKDTYSFACDIRDTWPWLTRLVPIQRQVQGAMSSTPSM